MPDSIKPLARTNDLIIQTIADETMVYDTITDRAYVLSPSAAAVWKACNGERTVQEIAHFLSRETPTNDQVVWYALAQLNPLLKETVRTPKEFAGLSRRQFLARTGLVAGAVAIPVVVSLVAPQAAHAQSATTSCCSCVVGGGAFQVDNCGDCTTACTSFGGVGQCSLGLCEG